MGNSLVVGGVCKTTVHQIDLHAKVRRYEPSCDLRFLISMAYLSDNGKVQGEGGSHIAVRLKPIFNTEGPGMVFHSRSKMQLLVEARFFVKC